MGRESQAFLTVGLPQHSQRGSAAPGLPLSAGSTNGRFPHVPLFRLSPMAAGLLCALGAALATAGPPAASAPDQTWNCRASAAYVAIPARIAPSRSTPTAARAPRPESPDRARCADDAGSSADPPRTSASPARPPSRPVSPTAPRGRPVGRRQVVGRRLRAWPAGHQPRRARCALRGEGRLHGPSARP